MKTSDFFSAVRKHGMPAGGKRPGPRAEPRSRSKQRRSRHESGQGVLGMCLGQSEESLGKEQLAGERNSKP